MSDDTDRRTESLSHASVELEPVIIEAVDGPGKGARLTLERGTAMVGAHTSCTLFVSDPAVSREHASLELLHGAVRVTDLESRNGTSYLGARVTTAIIPLGASFVVGRTTLQLRSAESKAFAPSEQTEWHGLIGKSLSMRRVFAALERLKDGDASVLFVGPTGTGKQLAARALHDASPRRAHPFVVLDCASVNPGIIESELFGHAKGAFSGASETRAGAFERAADGTLLLHQVDELPKDLQPKLLRVLEARTFTRLGEGTERKARARFLATSQRDLQAGITEGWFRSDLYYRLSVATVTVPALKQRLEDVAPLALHFTRAASGLDVKLDAVTLAQLQCHDWPGNVRQLRNAVQRALALGSDEPAPASDGEAAVPSYDEAVEKVVHAFEREYLLALLQRHQGNVSEVAKTARLARSTVYKLLGRHQIKG